MKGELVGSEWQQKSLKKNYFLKKIKWKLKLPLNYVTRNPANAMITEDGRLWRASSSKSLALSPQRVMRSSSPLWKKIQNKLDQ